MSGYVFLIFCCIDLCFIGFLSRHSYYAFKKLHFESQYPELASQSAAHNPIHNEFLLNLALEVNETRLREKTAADADEKASCAESVKQVSLEVVDTILSMNGFDPHEGEIFGADCDDEEDRKVVELASYVRPIAD